MDSQHFTWLMLQIFIVSTYPDLKEIFKTVGLTSAEVVRSQK
ncbi:hypothetical protein [Trichocoleus sp. FACHB-591]|nr:hypothetical protein [Trichocoleus sp. FACHB-591]